MCLLKRFLLITFFVLVIPCSTFGDKSSPDGQQRLQNNIAPLKNIFENTSLITLSNGLKVVLVKRNQAPVFTGQIHVRVGGVDEPLGRSGAAHLLEHMAFKGSKTIGTKNYRQERPLLKRVHSLLEKENRTAEEDDEIKKLEEKLTELWIDNEFGTIYKEVGAVGLNAGTAKDYTYYTVSLPKNAFEVWCWLESDRLLNPVFRQFYKERDVVLEERRSRVDDDPAGKLYEMLLAVSFLSHPYRVPVIGWFSEVSRLLVRDVEALHDTYYRPDNMVISLAGDLEESRITPLLEKYFGRLPVRSTELPQIITREEPQKGERRTEVIFDAQPRLQMAFHKPAYPDKDDLYFSILHSVLSDGRSSILKKELLRDKQTALGISAFEAPGTLYPSLFIVSAVPRSGVPNQQLIAEIQGIFDRLKMQPISERQLEGAKRRVNMELLSMLESNTSLATVFGQNELFYGDYRELIKAYEIIISTTIQDVRQLAEKYLGAEQRTVAEIVGAGANPAPTETVLPDSTIIGD